MLNKDYRYYSVELANRREAVGQLTLIYTQYEIVCLACRAC